MSDDSINISWGNVLTIWWAFFWRWLVFGILATLILAIIGGTVVWVIGAPHLAGPVGAVLGFLATFAVSLYAMRIALSKTYRHFSVRLIPYANAS
jgi:hypothetical protein